MITVPSPINLPIYRKFNPIESVNDLTKLNHYHWNEQREDRLVITPVNKYINWDDMAGHFLDLVEKMKIPNGYYWMRDDGTVFYSDIDLTDDPALKETVLQQSNGYNQHNTQFFKFLNSELGSYFDTVREIYPGTDDGGLVRILVQMPGQMIPVHMDTFVTYRKFFNVTSDVIVDRHSIFITPWKWGHFFHYGTSCVSNWKSGDSLIIENGVPHGSANAGYEPKITMQYDIRR